MKDKFVIIFVTCSSMHEAGKIRAAVLAKRLAACGNICGGVLSKFWWNGKIDSAKETMLVLKTKASRFKEVEKEVKRLHGYDVPEIIALPIIAGSAEYLGWIDDTV
jgi:periplasmic divalent cation tolerance protein